MSKTLREMFDELIMAVPFTNAETRYIPKIKVALEKQIPKKPSETDKARCICCGCVVKRSERFCKNCGQAILWESEE